MAGLEEELKVRAVEVEEKKGAADAMIPKLEAEKAKASEEAERANAIASEATKKEADVGMPSSSTLRCKDRLEVTAGQTSQI